MNPTAAQIYIYARVKEGTGEVLYVGQTLYPHSRWSRKALGGDHLKILRTAGWQDSARIEAQIIRAYKRRGQCRLNRLVIPKPNGAHAKGPRPKFPCTSISLEKPLWFRARKVARANRQSFSAYVCTLIEADLRSAEISIFKP